MVSDIVREKALLRPGGERWLRALPALVDELASAWDLRLGTPLSGGTESYVLGATTADGVEAVVKIELPGDPSFGARTRVFEAASGSGYARLLRYDEDRHAVVLERLGPSLATSGLSVRRQIELLCQTLRQVWGVSPAVDLDTAADKSRRLASFVAATWDELGRPCSEGVVDCALAFAESRERAYDPQTAVVLHG